MCKFNADKFLDLLSQSLAFQHSEPLPTEFVEGSLAVAGALSSLAVAPPNAQ